MSWIMSWVFGPEHQSELVRPTFNQHRYQREVVEHRRNQLSEAEKKWLERYCNECKRKLVKYSLCSPLARVCHGNVLNQLTLADHRTIRILVAGKTTTGKNACMNTFFALLGSEQDIGVNDHGDGDLTVEDHRLQVRGQDRNIIFTNIKGFGGEETDAQIMEALILGRLRHGLRCTVGEIQPHPVVLHEQCLAVIFVVSCEDYVVESALDYSPGSRFSRIAKQFRNLRLAIKHQDIVPITIVTKCWDVATRQIRADCQEVLKDAAEVVGSAPCHIFPFENLFPMGKKGTLQFQERFQERLDRNRLAGLMALQEALVQAELRLNRKNRMEDEELAEKKIVPRFMESLAKKCAWNEARYSQVMANLKAKWLKLPDHHGYLSPQNFIAICENARQDPAHSPLLSRVMSFQVLEGMEAMREEWQQQDE